MKLKFLKKEEINIVKWNNTITESLEPLTYAYSYYLDCVCTNWGALVSSDYQFVMPLPYFVKFNRIFIYQPKFAPTLGYFSKKIIDKNTIENIFKSLPSNVFSFEINFNKYNQIYYEKPISKKTFYSLDLINNYNLLSNNYTNYLKGILSINNELIFVSDLPPNEIIAFLNKLKYFKDVKNYEILRKIISLTSVKRLIRIISAYNNKNEIVGISIFINSKYTTDLLLTAAINDNPSIIAQMIDKFIKNNSNRNITLNFNCEFSQNGNYIFSEFGAVQFYKNCISYKKIPKILRFFSKK